MAAVDGIQGVLAMSGGRIASWHATPVEQEAEDVATLLGVVDDLTAENQRLRDALTRLGEVTPGSLLYVNAAARRYIRETID